jgi:hypothetical protein
LSRCPRLASHTAAQQGINTTITAEYLTWVRTATSVRALGPK